MAKPLRVEDADLGATAWPGAGDDVEDAVAGDVARGHTHAAVEGRGVGVELGGRGRPCGRCRREARDREAASAPPAKMGNEGSWNGGWAERPVGPTEGPLRRAEARAPGPRLPKGITGAGAEPSEEAARGAGPEALGRERRQQLMWAGPGTSSALNVATAVNHESAAGTPPSTDDGAFSVGVPRVPVTVTWTTAFTDGTGT